MTDDDDYEYTPNQIAALELENESLLLELQGNLDEVR
jgi:hypothetical protein